MRRAPRDPADELDIIKSMIERARLLSPSTSDAEWRRIEVEARARWGGRRYYIALTPEQRRARHALRRASGVGR